MKVIVVDYFYVLEGIGSFKIDYLEIDDFFYEGKEIFQFLLFCQDEEEKVYVVFFEFDLVCWYEYLIDVLLYGGLKVEGIKKVIECLLFDISDIYVFGDGLNDL